MYRMHIGTPLYRYRVRSLIFITSTWCTVGVKVVARKVLRGDMMRDSGLRMPFPLPSRGDQFSNLIIPSLTFQYLFLGSYTSEFLNSPRDSFNNIGNNSGTNSFSQPMGDSTGVFSSSNTNSSHYESSTNPPIRETGIIEKLLVSYYYSK